MNFWRTTATLQNFLLENKTFFDIIILAKKWRNHNKAYSEPFYIRPKVELLEIIFLEIFIC